MFQDGPITIVNFGSGPRTFPYGTAVFKLPNGNVVVINSTLNSSAAGSSAAATFTIYNPDTGAALASGGVGSEDPDITAAGSGFAIAGATRNSSQFNTDPTSLLVTVYTIDGQLIASTQIAQSAQRDTFRSDITTLNDGTLAVVWSGNRDPQVYLQRLDASGNKLGEAIVIGSEATGQFADYEPSVTALSDGGFVAVWTAYTPTANDTAILGRKFDAAGSPVGEQFSIDPSNAAVSDPQIAALPGGGFVVVYVATTVGGSQGVEAQIFTSGTTPAGPAFSVQGGGFEPEISADAQGNFIVAYLIDAPGGPQAYASSYTSDGVRTGLLQINPLYPVSGGYDSIEVAATSQPGVFEFSAQTVAPSLQSGYATLTGTLNTSTTPLGRTINGTVRSDVLYGDAGDNLFFGNGDSANTSGTSTYTRDIFDGKGGNDTVSFANATAGVGVTLPELSSDAAGVPIPGVQFYSIENLIGSTFNDTLSGNDAANRLDGGAGDDVIMTGRGGDTIIGGAGADTVVYGDSNGTVVVNLTLGKGFNNYADSDTYSGIENVSGSQFDDILIGDGEANEIRGQAGNDLLIGALGADVLIGNGGIDTIEFSDSIGTVFINLTLGRGYNNSAEGDLYFEIENVNGSRFDDFVIGDSGANRLDGGAGKDTLIGALGGDVLIGGDGIDTASYEDNQGAVFVNLSTGQGFNNAAQGDTYSGIENVNGGMFADYIIGNGGANRLDGMAGDDILIGGLGEDVLIGGAGFDTASYEDNWGAVFVNLLTGQGASNAAQGDSFDSIEGLVGGVFYDTFIGNDLRNVLNGKRGADTLTGNGGADDFVFDTAIDGSINVDRITDFIPGQDKIILDNSIFFTMSEGALQANNLIFGTEATGGQNRIIYDQATGRLWFDDDGNGTDPAVLFAVLENKPTLTPADFFVV